MIVAGTHARAGLRKMALGSVAETVFRHAMCPVLTLGRRAPTDASPNGRVRQILCPSDLSPDSARGSLRSMFGETARGPADHRPCRTRPSLDLDEEEAG